MLGAHLGRGIAREYYGCPSCNGHVTRALSATSQRAHCVCVTHRWGKYSLLIASRLKRENNTLCGIWRDRSEIVGFRCCLPEFCRLLVCYTALVGYAPTFRDNVSVPPLWVNMTSSLLKMDRYVVPKRRCKIDLRCVTSQKTTEFWVVHIFTGMLYRRRNVNVVEKDGSSSMLWRRAGIDLLFLLNSTDVLILAVNTVLPWRWRQYDLTTR
jgi:hypothetical protein